MDAPKKTASKKVTQNFTVIGIGASESSFDAIKQLIKGVSEDSGMAYILQYISPNDKSALSEIIAPLTNLPVHEIINTVTILPNNIYIIPQNTNLIILDGLLKLEPQNRSQKKNTVIDIFFESLAKIHKSHVIGVLLSGTDFDGTIGLKKIKELGGVTIAQEPKSATHKSIIQATIDANVVDYVLTPENIPEQLLRIRNSYLANNGYDDDENTVNNEEEVLLKIIDAIYLKNGNDFNHYKQVPIRRCIARRIVILQKETLLDYYNFFRNDKKEQDLLFNDILIPVTYFFRDEKFFESLHTKVFPKLIENIKNNNIRIWVPGCSTGEEAFSIAISLHEYLLKVGKSDITVQLFATDISEKYIAKARYATYLPQDVQNISEKMLQSYFIKKDGNYHISKLIRDMCVFAVHNFIKDPPFSKIDLVSCRNVLIYMDDYLQNKALETFHYSLKKNGILFLGKLESAANTPTLYEIVSEDEKIYTNKFKGELHSEDEFKSFKTNGVDKNEYNKNTVEEHKIVIKKSPNTEDGILDYNEILENCGEELQSNNEELRCINDELLDRQQQFAALQNYSEAIIETIHEPLIVINTEFIVKSANPAFYKFFNCTETETKGHNFFGIGDCQWNIPELKQQLSEILDSKIPVKDFEVEMLCSEVGKKNIKINAHHIKEAKPEAIILLALQDITDVVSINNLLLHKNQQLQKNNTLLEDFSAAASHDLQDPLRKIHMFCNRILENDKELAESTKYDLERIKFSLNNMGQLINDLISYSRINTVEKDFRKTDMNILVNKTLRDLNEDISDKSAIINVSLLPILKMIPYQIQQLFTNLILNSIKYSKDGTRPEITIKSEVPTLEEIISVNGESKEQYVKIKISDNGIGFDQDYADKIFQPFYRLHSKNKYKGSGLGLALVKKIINNHKAFIRVESKINEGTQFSIYLPK